MALNQDSIHNSTPSFLRKSFLYFKINKIQKGKRCIPDNNNKDISKIKKSPSMFIFSDKTYNIWISKFSLYYFVFINITSLFEILSTLVEVHYFIYSLYSLVIYSSVLYFVFIYTIEKLNLNYSLKNTPIIPGNISCQVKLIEKI